MKDFILLSLSLLAASIGFSQRLITEDFNYVAGSLVSVSDSVWTHFGGTTKPIQVIAGNLTYPNYTTNPSPDTSGLVFLDSAKSNAEDANIKFSTVDSGIVYCTFLLNVLDSTNLFGDSSQKGEAFLSFLPLSA